MNTLKRIVATMACAATGIVLLAAASAHAQSLVLYTASNPTIEKDILAAFSEAHPDIKVDTVNLSTGPITERAIAEKANPQADVIWMINNIALEQLKEEGVLEPFVPEGTKIAEAFREEDGFWHGHNATIMAMAVNTNLLKDKNLPMPSDWMDLIKPDYKGQITVAAPTKSGTGLSIFSTMHDALGWNFIDNLHQKHLPVQLERPARAARQVGGGETVIGLSYDTAILHQVPVRSRSGDGDRAHLAQCYRRRGGSSWGHRIRMRARCFSTGCSAMRECRSSLRTWESGPRRGYGNVDLSQVHLWKRRRPLDANEFKREWAAIYE